MRACLLLRQALLSAAGTLLVGGSTARAQTGRPRPVLALQPLVDILTFELDQQRYAVPSDAVVQVVQMVAISHLPSAPAVVEGVVNVRGTLVPVFDLRARIGLAPRAIDPSQHLIILRAADRLAAIRVDEATDFASVPDADITAPATLAATGVGAAATRHLAGIRATPDGTTIIYDLRAFLSLSESATLDAALVPAGG